MVANDSQFYTPAARTRTPSLAGQTLYPIATPERSDWVKGLALKTTRTHLIFWARLCWRFVMARRSGSSRTFRNDPQLQQYFLEGVAPTGKTLGVGSYGSVVEVKY